MVYAHRNYGDRQQRIFGPDEFMFRRQDKVEHQHAIYTTRGEFCRIFHEDMTALYLLALLLIRDHEQAEACFSRSLQDCFNSPPVFLEWARTWARRMVIMNAIRLCVPRELDGQANIDAPKGPYLTSTEMASVFSLPTFERFIFVISVLERYSDQECSLLLDCHRRVAHLTRIRALEQIAGQIGFDPHTELSCASGHGRAYDSTSFASLLTREI